MARALQQPDRVHLAGRHQRGGGVLSPTIAGRVLAPWFHRALGTPYGAVEDYLLWREDFEVWAEVEGHNLLTDEDIDGRFRVIDALHTEQLLVEDETGRAFTVGLGQQANISSRNVRVWKGESIVSSTYRLDLSGRLVSDLINSLPKGARRVYLNAALRLEGEADTPPVVGYFERVQKFGNEFEVRSATAGDLAPLSHLVIAGGSAVIRAEYSPGSEALADLTVASSTPSVKSHLLSIPNLPSLAGLLVEVGDEVEEGELIARYIDDEALELSQVELDEAKEKIPQLEETLRLEQVGHEGRLAGLEQAVSDAKEKRERVAYLVGRDAEPRAKLVEADAALRKAEAAVLTEKTGWTSERGRLQAQLKDAQLTVAKAERSQNAEMQKQWVRAPVAGLISDVRVVGVTTKGINLEVMMLEADGNSSGIEAAVSLPQH